MFGSSSQSEEDDDHSFTLPHTYQGGQALVERSAYVPDATGDNPSMLQVWGKCEQ